MTLTKMPWRWRDPKGIVHDISRRVRAPYAIQQIGYMLGCGHVLTVDDVNHRSRVDDVPTCLRCIVAPDNPNVINGE